MSRGGYIELGKFRDKQIIAWEEVLQLERKKYCLKIPPFVCLKVPPLKMIIMPVASVEWMHQCYYSENRLITTYNEIGQRQQKMQEL